jgi:glutathione synthase/RimK-type ligase-like ATP-grasp enzyme
MEKKKLKKKPTHFRSKIRSRHQTHSILRTDIKLLPFKSVIRLGSTTEVPDVVAKGGERIEINTVQAIKNSSNKLLMKKCFTEMQVKTAQWYIYQNGSLYENAKVNGNAISYKDIAYPIVVKSLYGSRGEGNHLIKSSEEFGAFIHNRNMSNYIIEHFFSGVKEYRLHVTKNGCFYACRKMLKNDAPEADRWRRHDDNCVWIVEDNPLFDKPINWNLIVEDCVKALQSTGLDIGAVDLKVQSTKNKKDKLRETPEWKVIEINSAPSFGEITAKKYLEELPKLMTQKAQEQGVL